MLYPLSYEGLSSDVADQRLFGACFVRWLRGPTNQIPRESRGTVALVRQSRCTGGHLGVRTAVHGSGAQADPAALKGREAPLKMRPWPSSCWFRRRRSAEVQRRLVCRLEALSQALVEAREQVAVAVERHLDR